MINEFMGFSKASKDPKSLESVYMFMLQCGMQRQEIISTLKDHEAALRARGVQHAALFGSLARGDNRPDSDIDVLIKIDPNAKIDLFAYVGITQYIDDLFEQRVDVANYDALKSLVRPQAERDAIYAF